MTEGGELFPVDTRPDATAAEARACAWPAPEPGADGSSPPLPFAEALAEAFWVCTLDDERLLYANAAFEEIFGLARDAAAADPAALHELVVEADRALYRDYRRARRRGPARLEYRIRRTDGGQRWIAERSYVHEDAARGLRLAVGFSEDVSAGKEAERRRIAALEAKRDALAREVHHRIKNGLQGAIGLLRRAASARPELAPALAEVTAQLRGLATVHGLQARSASGRVGLYELVRSVAATAQSLGAARIMASLPGEDEPGPPLEEKEAVPLALAVNELLVNAVKHARTGAKVRLSIEADAAAAEATLRIVNPGRLPAGVRAGSGGGSGLELVRMLLPPNGARFELVEAAGKVTATLRLEAPLLRPGG